MSTIPRAGTCAIADPVVCELLARVELGAGVDRVFHALTSREITRWWQRPGVFDTREWSGDVRVGGRWRAAGMFREEPYTQRGQFLEIEAPFRIVLTLEGLGKGAEPTIITYTLHPLTEGTRLLVRHTGFALPEKCESFALGWESSLERLAEMLTPELVQR
jgi:uncharacterized protein YndB with AHSA1/START domain